MLFAARPACSEPRRTQGRSAGDSRGRRRASARQGFASLPVTQKPKVCAFALTSPLKSRHADYSG